MPKENNNSLEGWMETIQKLGVSARQQAEKGENSFFSKNKPIKEFSIDREGITNYRVYDIDEDFMILYQLPNGEYSLRHKFYYDKAIVKELISCLSQ